MSDIKINKQREIKVGAVLGYVTYAVKLIVQLIYVPIMLGLLGKSEYGVYQLVASIVSYLSLLNFGFGGAYLRFHSQCKGNREKEAQLNGTFITIFLFFGLLAGIGGTFLTINSDWILGTKLSASELGLAKVLMAILTFNIVITFPTSVFSSIISSEECFIFQRVIELFKSLLNPFLVILLLVLGYGSVGMVLVSTVLTIIGALANIWYVFRKIKAPFSLKKFNMPLVKQVGAFSFFLFLNSIIDQINWNVDKFLLGRFVGSIAIAIYSVGAQINAIYIQITDMLATVLAPRINNIVANEKNPMKSLNALFVQVGRLQSFLVMAIVSGFFVFGKEFIQLWVGDGYNEAYYVTLLLIVPVSIPLCQTLGVDIQRALNKHQYRSIVYACIALLNLILSIPLAKQYGAIGTALGTTISLILGNGIAMNIMYQKIIGLDIMGFWKQIIKVCPVLILPVIGSEFLKRLLPATSWVILFTEIFIFVVIYGLGLYFWGMNKKEKDEVNKMLRLVRRRK